MKEQWKFSFLISCGKNTMIKKTNDVEKKKRKWKDDWRRSFFNPDEIPPDIKIRAYRLERWMLYIRSYSVKEKKVRATRHAFQENKMPEISRSTGKYITWNGSRERWIIDLNYIPRSIYSFIVKNDEKNLPMLLEKFIYSNSHGKYLSMIHLFVQFFFWKM